MDRPLEAWPGGPHPAQIWELNSQQGLPPVTHTTVPPDPEEAARQAEWRRAAREEERTRLLSALSSSMEPIELLVRAIAVFSKYRIRDDFETRGDDEFICDEDALRALFPDLWPTGSTISLGVNPPWNHDDIRAWFLNRVGRPTARVIRERRVLGFWSERRVPGWMFPDGSTYRGGKRGDRRPHIKQFSTLALTARGKVLYPRGTRPRGAGEGFNARALAQMANLVDTSGSSDLVRRPSPTAGPSPDPKNEIANMVMALHAETDHQVGWVTAT